MKTLHEEMILVVTTRNGKEMARRTVTVKVTPRRYTIISGLHYGDRFTRPSGAYIGGSHILGVYAYHLEPKP